MPEDKLREIEENAKFIVSGYAFFRKPDGFIGILNLKHPDCAMVVNDAGEIIETNMDPIEQRIVCALCERNLQFMED